MNKSDVKSLVEGSPSSIFHRTDVLALIDKIDECAVGSSGNDKIKEAIKEILESTDDIRDINTMDTEVELSLDGMEITVESVNVHGLDDAVRRLRNAAKLLRELLTGEY